MEKYQKRKKNVPPKRNSRETIKKGKTKEEKEGQKKVKKIKKGKIKKSLGPY